MNMSKMWLILIELCLKLLILFNAASILNIIHINIIIVLPNRKIPDSVSLWFKMTTTIPVKMTKHQTTPVKTRPIKKSPSTPGLLRRLITTITELISALYDYYSLLFYFFTTGRYDVRRTDWVAKKSVGARVLSLRLTFSLTLIFGLLLVFSSGYWYLDRGWEGKLINWV